MNDTSDLAMGGHTFLASRFDLTLMEDKEGRAPRASIVIANIGRPLSTWIEDSEGGVGASARIGEAVAGASAPDWELELDLLHPAVTEDTVTWELGFDPILGRPSVTTRYDSDTAPGLF